MYVFYEIITQADISSLISMHSGMMYSYAELNDYI